MEKVVFPVMVAGWEQSMIRTVMLWLVGLPKVMELLTRRIAGLSTSRRKAKLKQLQQTQLNQESNKPIVLSMFSIRICHDLLGGESLRYS